jgi:SNF2 family DNA or RNA helicase
MFPYQQEAVEWMEEREESGLGGFLCHEMGLGKTHIVCKHIQKRALRTLILTTKSTVQSWASTLRHYSQFAFDVRLFEKHQIIRADRQTVIVGTHQSVFGGAEWYAEQRFDRIVVDEAHVMRNQGKLFKSIIDLSKTIQHRWGLTATPFNNTESDIDAYMVFLFPDGRPPRAEFHNHFLRKLRKDVVEGGPQLHIHKVVYDFEYPEERMMYDYVSERIDETNDWIARNARMIPWRQRGQMALVLLIRKRQAAIHPQLVLNAEKVWAEQMQDVVDWDARKVTKVNKIAELVQQDQAHHKSTMVITHFKCELELLQTRLTEDGVLVKTLTGKTTQKDRLALEQYSGPACVVLLQIQAGGVGISLPWVSHVISASPDWNPFLEKQSIYRAYRINTPHDVYVTAMYFRDTIDISIQERQREKLEKSLLCLNDPLSSILDFVEMPA